MTDDHGRKGKAGLVIALLFAALPAAAQSLGDGIAAYALQDYATAESIFRQHADAGDADAAFRLGWLYENGRGAVAGGNHLKEAATWYARAADRGHAGAAERLAALAAEGILPEGADPLGRLVAAAEGGSVRAMLRLGRAYAAGEGAPLDPAQAADWFAKALGASSDPALRAYATSALAALGKPASPHGESAGIATNERKSQ